MPRQRATYVLPPAPPHIDGLRKLCKARCDFFQHAVLGHLMMPYHAEILNYQITHQHSMILGPRDSGKSKVCDIGYIVWKLIRDPNRKFCIASRSEGQAVMFLKEIKSHFERNEDLIALFGDLVGPIWNDTEIVLKNRTKFDKEPNVFAVGIGGGVVSKHFDEIIGDDLVDLENSQTDVQRKKVSTWFDMSLMPTLEPDGSLRILGTRYAAEDLYGELAKSTKQVTILQDGVKREETIYNDPIIGPNVKVVPAIQTRPIEMSEEELEEYKKIHGEDASLPREEFSFWPEKMSLAFLRAKRKKNSFIFSLQYQNDASVLSEKLISRDDVEPYVWINYIEVMSQNLIIYQGVDPAISLKQTADYFAFQTIGVNPDTEDVYDLENFKARLSFPDQVKYIIDQWRKWNPAMIGIESIAYQAALAGALRSVSIWISIQEIKTKLDKVLRTKLFSSITQNHRLHLAPGSIDLIETICNMPNVEHDDDFDAIFFACEAARLVSSVENPFIGFLNTNALRR